MLQVLDTEDVMAHLDDEICFHSSFEKHLKGIEKLLQTILIDEADLRRFLGAYTFWRRVVKDFAHIVCSSTL